MTSHESEFTHPMSLSTQAPSGRKNQSGRVLCIVLVAALVVILAVFLFLSFSNQAHDGHGQADPTKQSQVLTHGPVRS